MQTAQEKKSLIERRNKNMAVNRDPILKRCRSLQIDPSHMGIFKESKRTPHRNQYKKMSEYGLQLREKQRAKFIYGVLDVSAGRAYGNECIVGIFKEIFFKEEIYLL